MNLSDKKDLEVLVHKAIEVGEPLGLFIEMPGFESPELIINPIGNLEKKLEYWSNTYNDNLEHKHAKGIRIIGYTLN